MSNKKSTKRALITSILAMAVCLIMLIGTTFAWFTDTASTSVNSIKSGTLAVELQVKDEDGNWKALADDATLEFKKATAGNGQEIIWEPGCTYDLQDLRVVNNGNLALKYKVEITGIKGDAKLNEAIDWTITVGDASYDLTTEHKLAGKSGDTVDSDEIKISGTMKTTAGNEYQGLSIEGITIAVTATQDTVEYDSYNNTYDSQSEYPVYTNTIVDVSDVIDKDTNKIVTANETPITVTSTETVKDTETPVAEAEIPSGTELATGATSLSLVVSEAETPANIEVKTSEEAKTLEVHVNGLADTNESLIKVSLYIGKDLSGITLYHTENSKAETMTKVTDTSKLTAHNTYCYSSESGILTIAVKSFSPFTVVYATEPASFSVEKIAAKYGNDGKSMPAGVVITSEVDPVGSNGKLITVALKDLEAYIYFTQVFDRTAAYEALRETDGDYNMWYQGYIYKLTVKLECDIDLENETVKPFEFSGMGNTYINFDGNGHTIKNAKVSSSDNVGFFGRGVAIRNVTLDNIHVKTIGTETEKAGIVSYDSNAAIDNVTVKNSSVAGGKYTGAIVGYNYAGVTNCTVENCSVSGQYKMGGVIGYICSSGNSLDVTGNKLTNVTIKGENLWGDKKQYVIGKIVGNWNATSGNCKNNTFSGTTDAADMIGEIESNASVEQ